MAKFNKVKQGVKPTEINADGERAYKLSAKDELVATVLTTFLTDSYYEKQKEIVNRILKAADDCEPLFVAKLALYARTQANMRSVSHLLAAHVAKRISGEAYAKHFYEQIIVRPDDMSEIIACFAALNSRTKLRKLPNSLKKGFSKRLAKLDAYSIDKYKMERREVTLVDLVNLVHPCPTDKNKEAYRRLMKGESLADLYASKILDKELTKTGQDDEYSSEDAFRSVLFGAQGMPIFALLRNLKNILEKSPSCVDEACRQLVIRDKILKSKLLPFRFATAYSEIAKLNTGMFEKDVKNVRQVLGALEKAINISVENIPKLKGNVAVLVDNSGSVRGDAGGTSLVSSLSKTTMAMVGNITATMLAYSQDNVYIGLFGDRLIDVPIDRDMGALKFNRHSYDLGAQCGQSSESGLYEFLDRCVREKINVDNLMIFSDMVIGDHGQGNYGSCYYKGGFGTFQALFKAFKQVNPHCHTVCVDVRQTQGTCVFDASLNVSKVAGWSDKIFELMSKKSHGYAELIAEVERINIVGQ